MILLIYAPDEFSKTSLFYIKSKAKVINRILESRKYTESNVEVSRFIIIYLFVRPRLPLFLRSCTLSVHFSWKNCLMSCQIRWSFLYICKNPNEKRSRVVSFYHMTSLITSTITSPIKVVFGNQSCHQTICGLWLNEKLHLFPTNSSKMGSVSLSV